MSLVTRYKSLEQNIQRIKEDNESRARYALSIKAVDNKFKNLAKEFRNEMFEKQREFYTDESLLSSALCTRRAGKSEGAKKEMLATALEIPHANVLYGTFTRDKAKAICWSALIRALVEKGLKRIERGHVFEEDGDFKTDEQLLEIYFKNGSRIKLTGFDSSEAEIDKVLGEPYDLVIIDEVQSFKGNVSDLIYKRLLITVGERFGRIKMIGTPGDVKMGFFYDVNCTPKPQKLKWALFKWSWKDNIALSTHEKTKNMKMCDIFHNMLDQILAENPEFVNTPEYYQEWLGEYFIDTDNLVYKFDPMKNVYKILPKITDCIMGVDLGWNDETAITVLGWTPEDPNLYQIDEFYEKHCDLDKVAEQVLYFKSIYPINEVIIDSQNKQGIQTIEKRYFIGFKPADKMGKFEHIRLMNTDLGRGRIKFPETSVWIQEASKLKKKTKAKEGENGKVMEDDKAPNHMCDANLYAYLRAKHYWFTETIEIVDERTALQKQNEIDRKNRFEKQENSDTLYEDGYVSFHYEDY